MRPSFHRNNREVKWGSVKIASQAGHGPNSLAWAFAALAVAVARILASWPYEGQIAGHPGRLVLNRATPLPKFNSQLDIPGWYHRSEKVMKRAAPTFSLSDSAELLVPVCCSSSEDHTGTSQRWHTRRRGYIGL